MTLQFYQKALRGEWNENFEGRYLVERGQILEKLLRRKQSPDVKK